LDIELRV